MTEHMPVLFILFFCKDRHFESLCSCYHSLGNHWPDQKQNVEDERETQAYRFGKEINLQYKELPMRSVGAPCFYIKV